MEADDKEGNGWAIKKRLRGAREKGRHDYFTSTQEVYRILSRKPDVILKWFHEVVKHAQQARLKQQREDHVVIGVGRTERLRPKPSCTPSGRYRASPAETKGCAFSAGAGGA